MTPDDENIGPAPEPDPVVPDPSAESGEPGEIPAAAAAAAPAAGAVRGRLGWKRFAALLVPSSLAAAGLVVLTAQGVLAASFSISGIAFTVTSPKLTGTGFEQYGGLDNMAPNSPNAGSTGGQVLIVTSVIGSAKLYGLCQSVSLGPINLVIHAGSSSNPVTATDLVVDSSQISGNATFNSINIGQDASTVDDVPGYTGPLGDFAQQSKGIEIDNLRQTNYATTAALFKLPGLSIGFSGNGC